jgi:lipoyl(octanoyl) transferase
MPRTLSVHRLGIVDYDEAHALQERLVDERIAGERGDVVLLLEHPPVITLGRGAKEEHLLVDRERLHAQGVHVADIGRGGDVTYHGPGQLVAYPILDLNPDRKDVRRYVRDLEEVMIRVAAHYDLVGSRIEGLNGAWIDGRKLGAVGVRIRRWVTMHGIALNVSTNLDAYDLIVPCGIRDKEVTSLSRELGREPAMREVEDAMTDAFAAVFDADVTRRTGAP